MTSLNNITNLKLRTVSKMTWNEINVFVEARPFHALCLRSSGSGIIHFENQKLEVKTGEIIYLPANTSYYAEYFDKTEMIAIHFDADVKGVPEVFPYPLYSLFEKCHDLWKGRNDGYYFDVSSAVYSLLSNIIKFKSNEKYPLSFIQATEYMKENFTDSNLNVTTLVDIAKMSDTYFRKLFIEKYRETPAKHIMKLRLEFAESLLATNCHTISEVASLSGFSDSKYFSRAVKKAYGVMPSKLFKK